MLNSEGPGLPREQPLISLPEILTAPSFSLGEGGLQRAGARIRKKVTLVVALLLMTILVPETSHADPRWQFPTATERHLADVTSWGTVAAAVALDSWHTWQCPNRLHCIVKQAERLGVTYGLVFGAKLLVHRARPCAPLDCGSDNPNYSFFSGHTAAGFQTLGGPRLAFVLPLAISTGGLRVAAGKHWPTDVLTGAGVGLLTSRIR